MAEEEEADKELGDERREAKAAEEDVVEELSGAEEGEELKLDVDQIDITSLFLSLPLPRKAHTHATVFVNLVAARRRPDTTTSLSSSFLAQPTAPPPEHRPSLSSLSRRHGLDVTAATVCRQSSFLPPSHKVTQPL
ncbi:hypothetical protein Droror1_Dr00004366 [Drosera rotundifolia]